MNVSRASFISGNKKSTWETKKTKKTMEKT